MNKYNPGKIEQKWQKYWEDNKSFCAEDISEKPKFYPLIEFPYPSGAGLHVGHPRPYTGMDIIARKKRMEGYNVLYPIGFDAFGLPTENYAIKTGRPPAEVTAENIANFTRQIKNLGISFDWSRVVDTTDPKYYKWTQWIFLQLFKHGLAYKKNMPINWCPSCKIGLANEEVVDGKCERCGSGVVKKDKYQWMLAITKYADKLLAGLEDVDYIERAKVQQQNWIGKSEGAKITFQVVCHPELVSGSLEKESNNSGKMLNQVQHDDFKIEVFTTRPDTLFGVTYMVLSPEHILVEKLQDKISNFVDVKDYINKAKMKSDLERTELQKEKTGVKLQGVKAINPVNNEEIPVFVADYVLATYGTGAIMAVPAHDERDFEFAKKYSLEIKEVVIPDMFLTDEQKQTVEVYNNGVQEYLNKTVDHSEIEKQWFQNFVSQLKPKGKVLEIGSASGRDYEKLSKEGFVVDATDITPNFVKHLNEKFGEKTARILNIVEEGIDIEKYDGIFANASLIHLTPEQFEIVIGKLSRVLRDNGRFALSLKLGNGKVISERVLPGERYYYHWDISELENVFNKNGFKIEFNITTEVGRNNWVDFILTKSTDVSVYSNYGKAINSEFLNGLKTEEAKEKMIVWLEEKKIGKKQINFKLRDWVFSRQRYWGEPIPLVYCEKCAHENKSGNEQNPGWFAIAENELPLELPQVEKYEPTDDGESPLSQMTDWVKTTCPNCGGEARRETDTMPNWAGSSWYFLRYIDPHNDTEFASQEKLKYWMPVDWYNGGMEHTVLHLLYSRFWNEFLFDIGLVPTSEPYKKRTSHGMILAKGGEKMSKSKGNVVNPDDVVADFGADTFRTYSMFIGPFDQAAEWDTNGLLGVRRFLERVWNLQDKIDIVEREKGDEERIERLLHQTIKKVTDDIDNMRFNTAVAKLMELSNEVNKSSSITKEDYLVMIKLLSPFAPHMAEEIWSKLGNEKSIATAKWPEYEESKLKEDVITIVVQINGKVRGSVEVPVEISEEDIKIKVLELEDIQKWLEGKEPKKVIYVKGRLVSVVV